MNSLVIILIAVVVLGAGYLGYGRWLAKKWGIDANAKTPAVANEDGKDYVPSSKLTVFAHQFSSIAGAGPVTGPIIAAMDGYRFYSGCLSEAYSSVQYRISVLCMHPLKMRVSPSDLLLRST